MKIMCKPFQSLTIDELYDIMALRTEVFVIEQHCMYQDQDYYDQKAHHLLFYDDNDLPFAYCRIFAPDIKYPESSIGRVLVKKTHRNQNHGHELIRYAINQIEALYHTKQITISAQEYLKNFYEQHGFIVCSETYLEDQIPHIKMTKK